MADEAEPTPSSGSFAPIQSALLDLLGAARALLDATETLVADPTTFDHVTDVVGGWARQAVDVVGPLLRNAARAATGLDDDSEAAGQAASVFEHVDLG